MLDTGSTRTLVRRDLVPRRKMVDGEVAITCAHGSTTVYPLADVEIGVKGHCLTVQCSILSSLLRGFFRSLVSSTLVRHHWRMCTYPKKESVDPNGYYKCIMDYSLLDFQGSA